VSKNNIAFAKGRAQGIRESGWTCGDCGNLYDASVDCCPNRLLDEAGVALTSEVASHVARKRSPKSTIGVDNTFGYRAADRTPDGKVIVVGPFDTREEAEQAAAGQPIVELPGTLSNRDADEPERHRHLVDCPCEHVPCCPWMGECTCQCLCDFIALIEERVRSEYDPSENDANEGYRTGYATAVAEYLSNQDNDAAYKLGYDQALQDNESKPKASQSATFATVEELMNDLHEDTP